MMRATLIALAMLLVLGCAAACGEPAATPAAEATPAYQGPEPAPWGWKGPSAAEVWIGGTVKEMLLGVFVLICFVAGLIAKRHDWKPLVVGLFTLGIGLLETMLAAMSTCEIIVACHRPRLNPAELAEGVYCALPPAAAGLVVALLGGLFTMILRWRNKRLAQE